MPASRSCMRQEIRDALLRRILEGRYDPGERLLELQLAEEFHTSQAPVREALRELEALGYVETAPYRGTRVREIPPSEMRDAYRLRALIEREAAEAAALNEEADWGDLEGAVDGLERAMAADSALRYVRHDEKFHRGMLIRSRNAVLLQHWDLLVVPTRILVALEAGVFDMSESGPEHRPILEALQQGKAKLAGRLAFAHVNRIALRMEERTAVPTG